MRNGRSFARITGHQRHLGFTDILGLHATVSQVLTDISWDMLSRVSRNLTKHIALLDTLSTFEARFVNPHMVYIMLFHELL
jgi:hypothetical protein